MAINWWGDEQNVVYPNNGILFGRKKEWNMDTYYSMDEPWKHYAKWKKQVKKDTYYVIPFIWNVQNKEI